MGDSDYEESVGTLLSVSRIPIMARIEIYLTRTSENGIPETILSSERLWFMS